MRDEKECPKVYFTDPKNEILLDFKKTPENIKLIKKLLKVI